MISFKSILMLGSAWAVIDANPKLKRTASDCIAAMDRELGQVFRAFDRDRPNAGAEATVDDGLESPMLSGQGPLRPSEAAYFDGIESPTRERAAWAVGRSRQVLERELGGR